MLIKKYLNINLLIEQISQGYDPNYIFFWGHRYGDHKYMSQWYGSQFHAEGETFRTAEHWMMYHKARIFKDDDIANKILKEDDQATVKWLGRHVENFDESIWDKHKFKIVVDGNYYKFKQNKDIRNKLLSTKDAILVEASPYDKIWGIGMDAKHKYARCPEKWKGENLLGFALMEVRKKL